MSAQFFIHRERDKFWWILKSHNGALLAKSGSYYSRRIGAIRASEATKLAMAKAETVEPMG